jgi:thioesterase domain-containing protein
MFTDPTPRRLAARIDAARAGADSGGEAFGVLLPLRSTGTEAPLFCIHPFIGLSWSYGGLTQYVGVDRPVYGIQSPALSGGQLPDTIEEIAALYLEHVRGVQPEGPYHLLGWSFGGVVAHAMAVQLRDAGEQVATVALLDSHLELVDGEDSVDENIRGVLGGLGIDIDLGPNDADLTIEDVVEMLGEVEGFPATLTADRLARVVESAGRAGEQIEAYRPRPFDGEVDYFVAGRDRTLGASQWTSSVRAISTHEVDVDHNAMTSPQALAAIGPVLDAVLRGIRD